MNLLNYGIPTGETERRLVIVDERDVPRVTRAELADTLQVFADGYRAARDALAAIKPEREESDDRRPDPNQRDLFGEDPKM